MKPRSISSTRHRSHQTLASAGTARADPRRSLSRLSLKVSTSSMRKRRCFPVLRNGMRPLSSRRTRYCRETFIEHRFPNSDGLPLGADQLALRGAPLRSVHDAFERPRQRRDLGLLLGRCRDRGHPTDQVFHRMCSGYGHANLQYARRLINISIATKNDAFATRSRER